MTRTTFRTPLALAAALAAGAALAIEFPPLKSGLWETQVVRDGAATKAGAMKMCMDAAVRKEVLDMGMGTMKNACAKNDMRRDGNRMYGDSVCKFGESTIKSTSVTTFTGETGYRTEIKATYDPPLMGRSSGTTVIDAKWTGPCPAGMQPGDIAMPDGRTMNMRNAAPK